MTPLRTLAILSYHKIGAGPGGWDTWYYVSEAIFEKQLTWLRDNGWRAIDCAAFLRGLRDPESLPERALLMTFDDGYRTMRTVAMPILQRFAMPAIVFMPTAFIGGMNTFDAGNEPDEPMAGWDDLRALEQGGVSVQSHAVSHPAFSKLTPAQMEEELRDSKLALETGLRKPVEVFAFPYGDGGMDPALTTELLHKTGYAAACLYGGGPITLPASDFYRLARLTMGPDTDLAAVLAG
jgi:peptidoglycan/xylan/chitin deacetylase (PgdA/CDA1 family)